MVLDIFLAVRAPPSPPLVLQILILFLPVEKILMLKLPEIRVLIVLLDDSQHYFVFCFCSEIGMKKKYPLAGSSEILRLDLFAIRQLCILQEPTEWERISYSVTSLPPDLMLVRLTRHGDETDLAVG